MSEDTLKSSNVSEERDFLFLMETYLIDLIKNVCDKYAGDFIDFLLSSDIYINELKIYRIMSFVFIIYSIEANMDGIENDEYLKLQDFFNNFNGNMFVQNYKIRRISYIILCSIIETIKKTKDGNYMKKLDVILVKNLKRIQTMEDVNYDPKKTPIVKEILDLVSSYLDSINFYEKVNENISKTIDI